MTSNVGAAEFAVNEHGSGVSDDVRQRVLGVMQQSFAPEFLNRIDEVRARPRGARSLGCGGLTSASVSGRA